MTSDLPDAIALIIDQRFRVDLSEEMRKADGQLEVVHRSRGCADPRRTVILAQGGFKEGKPAGRQTPKTLDISGVSVHQTFKHFKT